MTNKTTCHIPKRAAHFHINKSDEQETIYSTTNYIPLHFSTFFFHLSLKLFSFNDIVKMKFNLNSDKMNSHCEIGICNSLKNTNAKMKIIFRQIGLAG